MAEESQRDLRRLAGTQPHVGELECDEMLALIEFDARDPGHFLIEEEGEPQIHVAPVKRDCRQDDLIRPIRAASVRKHEVPPAVREGRIQVRRPDLPQRNATPDSCGGQVGVRKRPPHPDAAGGRMVLQAQPGHRTEALVVRRPFLTGHDIMSSCLPAGLLGLGVFIEDLEARAEMFQLRVTRKDRGMGWKKLATDLVSPGLLPKASREKRPRRAVGVKMDPKM